MFLASLDRPEDAERQPTYSSPPRPPTGGCVLPASLWGSRNPSAAAHHYLPRSDRRTAEVVVLHSEHLLLSPHAVCLRPICGLLSRHFATWFANVTSQPTSVR